MPRCPLPGSFLFLHQSLGQAGLELMTCPALSWGDALGCDQAPRQHHQGPQNDGKKQMRALASMDCKIDQLHGVRKQTGRTCSRAFPVQEALQQPHHQPGAVSPLQTPCLNSRRRCLATVSLFKERQRLNQKNLICVVLVCLSFCSLFSRPNYLKRERGLEQLWEPLAMAHKARLLLALSYASVHPPPSQPPRPLHPKAQAEHPSKGLLSCDFLTATVALGCGEPSSPFDRAPRAKEQRCLSLAGILICNPSQ